MTSHPRDDTLVRAVPVLQELARSVTGDPQAALGRLLTLVCEQLAMDVAVVSLVDSAGIPTVRTSAKADGTPGPVGLEVPLTPGWCGQVVTDGVLDPSGAASFARVPLLDEHGVAFGALCVFGRQPHTTLTSRDHDVLAGLAEVIAPKVLAMDAPPEPQPGLGALATLAAAVQDAHDVEQLSRPLLDALGDLTGLASAYLTVVHADDDLQEIRYAHNTRDDFEVPEGMRVPWEDTLCKRALDEDRPCTTDVPAVWGDNDAARSLGLQVYISVPVEMPDGRLWGTLCAADSRAVDDVEAHLPTMRLFARLIAAQVDREAAVQRARAEADTDPLTGCASRRVVDPWLSAQLAALPSTEVLVVAFADLDSFKSINDSLGHGAGDAVLAEVGRRLRDSARPHDLVARLGGDEFLVAACLPRSAVQELGDRIRTALAFRMPWGDTAVEVRASVGLALSDDPSGGDLVAMADKAMYGVKSPLLRRTAV